MIGIDMSVPMANRRIIPSAVSLRGSKMSSRNYLFVGIVWVMLLFAQQAEGVSSQVPDLVYLNRCTGNCPLGVGTDDAVNRKSSILNGSATAPAFAYSDDTFNQIAACTRAVLAPFNIRVTVFDPGSRPREEVILTTYSESIGLSSNIGALAPYSGSREPNTIGFVFASLFNGNVDDACWGAATVVGTLYSLDRVTPCADIMSFGIGCGEKAFTNIDSTCDGSTWGTPGKCRSGEATQNSFAILSGELGLPDTLFAQGFEAFEVPHSGPAP
ncbi:MAG TPA: hypothetical protein VLK26_08240 [Rudaea sp.]|nr:hypothetical protein [Rudaea sp.]